MITIINIRVIIEKPKIFCFQYFLCVLVLYILLSENWIESNIYVVDIARKIKPVIPMLVLFSTIFDMLDSVKLYIMGILSSTKPSMVDWTSNLLINIPEREISKSTMGKMKKRK